MIHDFRRGLAAGLITFGLHRVDGAGSGIKIERVKENAIFLVFDPDTRKRKNQKNMAFTY